MQICPQCGQSADDSRHYCPECGAPLTNGYGEKKERHSGKKAGVSRRFIVAAALLIVALALFLLIPRPVRYTSHQALVDEYVALIRTGDAEKLSRLFVPELVKAAGLDMLDTRYNVGSDGFSLIGKYEATDSSGMDAQRANELIEEQFGITGLAGDYRQYLVGIVVNDADVWLQLDLILADGYWYIWRVT